MDVWWPEGAPPQAHVVPNGIDVDAWPYSESGDGSAVWAGRITATKGAHLAVEAARIAGMPLTLFGAVEHRDYFDAEVVPRLGGGIRYGGHLGARELAAEFGRASVFVFTPLWDEPFGLVAAEAMACGLPVAATDMGAVREVIGPCGRYAPPDNPHALAAAMIEAAALPRGPVRDEARARFGLNRMLDALEGLYGAARAGRTAPAPSVAFARKELPPAEQAPVAG
jgi:glycosyltransferase involved in cell wall biosynthesis